jgi:hypothetical protein
MEGSGCYLYQNLTGQEIQGRASLREAESNKGPAE